MVRLLAISGSLREGSSNARLLAAAQLVRLDGLTIKTYCGLDQLPHFNPDLLQSPPEPVLALYALIADTDGLLISCPEYARGIPGSFKNMLDWLVSSESFPGMPVALLNASPRVSCAQAALRLVLETMSACIVEPACFTVDLLASAANPAQLADDPEISQLLLKSLEAMKLQIEVS